MAEKYYSISPYAYCLNNPLKYTDPTGMWTEDKDGNLVAEDKDNQESLAKYLNTTTDIALSMMIEQILDSSSEDNGEAFVLQLGGDRYAEDVDLVGFGNNIKDRAGSQFSKDMYTHYVTGKGEDVELSSRRFGSLLLHAKKTNQLENEGKSKVVNFYNSEEYKNVIGSGKINFNEEGKAIGFFDTYDFDAKNWFGKGSRSFNAEFKTRMVRGFSPGISRAFNITYTFTNFSNFMKKKR